MVWNIPMATPGHLHWLCSCLASCSSSLQQSRVSTAEQQPKHQHVINIILILSPKYSPEIWAADWKINSIPSESRTQMNVQLLSFQLWGKEPDVLQCSCCLIARYQRHVMKNNPQRINVKTVFVIYSKLAAFIG